MVDPPALDPGARPGALARRRALLINPFYPKDPHASFGKHVLTPTLALTSVAAATPPHWHVEVWDENLLQGPPPLDPLPEVVGITVHLTFADRAYALARWYRARGSRVVLGGLHVQACPDEAAPHADALAVGDGVALWPLILRDVEAGSLRPVYRARFDRPYRDDPPPRRDLLARAAFLTTTSLNATRGCHNYKRCNLVWHRLIRHRLTHAVWWSLVAWTRRRHLRFRERLERLPISGAPLATPARFVRARSVVSAGV